MKPISLLFPLFCILAGCPASRSTTAPPVETSVEESSKSSLHPHWKGSTRINETLALDFNVSFSQEKETLTGKISIPVQGVANAPLSSVLVENGVLSFHLATPNAPELHWPKFRFEGVLQQERVTGSLAQAGQVFETTLQRVETLQRPQTPQPPFPYTSRDVTYAGADTNTLLAGTLTVPPGEGPHPAVILISGSGPQDRNGTVMGHPLFWVIADHLSRRGVAVLRVDDRGVGTSTGARQDLTSLVFADDVSQGVSFLSKQPEIDPTRIGLIGHSEGGLIGPIVASTREDVAFLVLLAGPGVNGFEILIRQNAEMFLALGAAKEDVDTMVSTYRGLLDPSRATPPTEEEIRPLIEQQLALSGAPPMDDSTREVQLQHHAKQFQALQNSPWIQTFMKLEPATYLKQVSAPVLALNGTKDLQVLHDQNLPAIAAALEAGGNTRTEVHQMEGLNHLFQTAEKGTVEEYAVIEETISPAVLQKISDWLSATLAPEAVSPK
jgi:uncharacterized protein